MITGKGEGAFPRGKVTLEKGATEQQLHAIRKYIHAQKDVICIYISVT
jgi:hypothetical protein